jgi:glutaminyl-tRNA synthetase
MSSTPPPNDFIRQIVAEDLASNKHAGSVMTRFPPEPNGFLHVGHVKSICLNFGVAKENGGKCNLRFDDTNPVTEDELYMRAIEEDVRWLGFDWPAAILYASDYFEQLYQWAVLLIEKGLAYVDSLTAEQIREHRGVPGVPGKDSPHRGRSIEENLDLFDRMKKGEFPDGTHVLRAKIDMASPNFNMRDPTIYRIKHAHHPRTGDAWCVYPMYDYAHALSDALESITHSLCTLEFEDHRPLYDWVLDAVGTPEPQPRQIEFARLNLDYTMMSKRKLKLLVEEGHVRGWDDPRMPTVAGMRRRGYPPAALRDFVARTGISKNNGVVELGLLEACVREELDRTTPRVMCVPKPLKITIENYPQGEVEEIDAPYHPTDTSMGSRKLPFSRVLYIDAADFMLDPPKKFFRLGPGREVRLRWAYIIKCERVVTSDAGEVTELVCSYDPATRGAPPDGRKVKGTVQWVSAEHAVPCELRLYDRLFSDPNPGAEREGVDFRSLLNPASLETTAGALVEPSLSAVEPGARYQFERMGYFCVDPDAAGEGAQRVFNRTVTLRDSWAKIAQES